MPRPATPPDELTPAGALQEGGIHALLGYQLAQAAIVTTAAFVHVVGKPLALRPVEFTILQLVHENPHVTATQLARALAVSAPAVTIWLDRLQGRGLLERATSTSDRRAQSLRNTRKGDELVEQALQGLLQADREILDALSVGERQMLLELVHKVARARKR